MWIDIENSKDRVRYLLENYPRLRDSDEQLAVEYWSLEMQQDHKSDLMVTAFEFLNHYLGRGKLTNYESIRRYRQVLQVKYPHLQGDLYKERHARKEKIKKQVKTLKAA